jgi:DNA-binding CsgD family transcriptional regulator
VLVDVQAVRANPSRPQVDAVRARALRAVDAAAATVAQSRLVVRQSRELRRVVRTRAPRLPAAGDTPAGSVNEALAVLEQLVAELRRHEAAPPAAAPVAMDHGVPLTRRQLEILALLADGLGTDQIGRKLWLSRSTVRNHVTGLLRALGVHSRLEAVARARSLGLL